MDHLLSKEKNVHEAVKKEDVTLRREDSCSVLRDHLREW